MVNTKGTTAQFLGKNSAVRMILCCGGKDEAGREKASCMEKYALLCFKKPRRVGITALPWWITTRSMLRKGLAFVPR